MERWDNGPLQRTTTEIVALDCPQLLVDRAAHSKGTHRRDSRRLRFPPSPRGVVRQGLARRCASAPSTPSSAPVSGDRFSKAISHGLSLRSKIPPPEWSAGTGSPRTTTERCDETLAAFEERVARTAEDRCLLESFEVRDALVRGRDAAVRLRDRPRLFGRRTRGIDGVTPQVRQIGMLRQQARPGLARLHGGMRSRPDARCYTAVPGVRCWLDCFTVRTAAEHGTL